MAVLSDIPITSFAGITDTLINLPQSNLTGNWNAVQIILTNNLIAETYPLTQNDNIITAELTLIKGSTSLPGVKATFVGGQSIDAKSGNPSPRSIWIQRPQAASGTISISGIITFHFVQPDFISLDLGARIEYF